MKISRSISFFRHFCILLLLLHDMSYAHASGGSQLERELADFILQNYSTNYRPVHNPSTTINVQVFPTIYGIAGLTWTDQILEWENSTNQAGFKAEFQQFELIYIPVNLIWVPDVVVFNALEKKDIIDRNQVIAKVYRNGTVTAEFPQVLTTICSFDISDFPFDTQNCTMTYGSWSLPSKEIVVTTTVGKIVDISGVVLHNHPEWDVIAISSNNRQAGYLRDASTNATSELFSELDITVSIKRKPAYYIYVLIIPTFVIAIINSIGLFNMKRDREEKVTMGLTTLLATAVILNIVATAVPKSQLGLPLLGNYVLFEILITSADVLVTVIILFIHERALLYRRYPPSWLLCICLIKDERLDNKDHVDIADIAANFSNSQGTNNNNASMINDKYLEILKMLRAHLLRAEKQAEGKRLRWILEDQWARVLLNVDLIMMVLFILGNILGSFLIIYQR